jgi:chaperonin GroEL (HSP60 family)
MSEELKMQRCSRAYTKTSTLESKISTLEDACNLLYEFDSSYTELIDKTRELYIHLSRKDELIQFLVQHRGEYYYNYIKVIFTGEINKNKAYIREIK